MSQWPPLVHIRVQVLQAQVVPSVCPRGLGKCQVCPPIITIFKTRSREFQIVCIGDAADSFPAYRLSTSKKSNAMKDPQTEKAIIPCSRPSLFCFLTRRSEGGSLLCLKLWFGIFHTSRPTTTIRFSTSFVPRQAFSLP